MKITKQEQEALEIFKEEYQKILETKRRDIPAFRLAVARRILELNKPKKIK